MKLAMSISPMIDDGEINRRQELQIRHRGAARVRAREKFRRQLAAGTRKVFVFLLGAAIVVFVVAHRTEIHSLAANKITRVAAHIQVQAGASPLRQGALNYENEVNEIAAQ